MRAEGLTACKERRATAMEGCKAKEKEDLLVQSSEKEVPLH